MRHAPGLAASPLGGINWKWRGAGNGLSLPVSCGRTTSSRSGDAPGTAIPPAQGDPPCAHGGRYPAGVLPPKFHDRTSTEPRKASRSLGRNQCCLARNASVNTGGPRMLAEDALRERPPTPALRCRTGPRGLGVVYLRQLDHLDEAVG